VIGRVQVEPLRQRLEQALLRAHHLGRAEEES
jgi:hypothetical protein